MKQNERGITLIALLVMVIVLIMISAVVIRGLTDDKLIDTSMTTVDEYNIASYKEQVEQAVRGIVLKNAAGGRDTSIGELAEDMEGTETIWVKEAMASDIATNNSDMLVTVIDGYVYQVYYDSTYGVVFTEYVGKDDGKGFPSLNTAYSRSKAKITGSATAEEGAAIEKVELIYKGAVQETASNASNISFDVEKIGTGWYIVKATSSSGKVRYNWIRVSTVSDKLRAPRITVVATKGQKNGSWYNAENVPIKVTIQANSSAASGIKYWQDTEITTKPDTDGTPGDRTTTFDLSTEGKTTIMAVEVDEEGNESEEYATEIVKIDTVKPDTSISQKTVNSQVSISDPKGWYKEAVKIDVAVEDKGSGPDGYEYLKRDGEVEKGNINGEDWVKVSGGKPETPISITEDGITTYAIRGLDVAGNKSDITTVPIRLDKTAPKFDEVSGITISGVTTTGCIVKATATDEWSGSEIHGGRLDYTCTVKENGEDVAGAVITPSSNGVQGEFNITGLSPKKTYTITISATDLARKNGNNK